MSSNGYRLMLLGAIALSLTACNGGNRGDNMEGNFGDVDTEIHDRIELQASAVQRVNNDEIEAVLFIEKTAANPKTLSQQINPIIKAALEKAKAYPDVKLMTANQNTNPNYDYKTNRISSWSTRSELRLESTDFEAAGELIGALQDAGIQVSNIAFKVSDAQRQKVENDMITQVTDSFKQRAEVVKKSWGAADYKLVKLSIKSNTNVPDTPYYGDAVATASMEVDASAAAPLSGGDQRVEMVAQGAIELIK